jgi:hydroxyacylglutathione hydrolase
MLLERFEDPDLAQYSYAVGCERARQIAIVDPRRDLDDYLDFADRRGIEITQVIETHIHADFASGARELSLHTGAPLRVSAYDRGEAFEVAFAHDDLHDGERVELGRVVLEARHTPGHTPEHLSLLVFDGARSSEVPIAMLSGDFLFVGSVGRPDLLGEEAKVELARQLFRSVCEGLAGLPDGLEIHPGHGAGSMCGAGMSGRPRSTLGFERVANPYLDPALSEEQFVERLLADVPPFPPYYRRMKRVNSEGPPLLGGLPGERPLPVARFQELVEGGHLVIDLRDQIAFGGGHVPGALGIGVDGRLSTWAAWMAPYDRPLLLVLPTEERFGEAARALIRVGLDSIEGYLEGGFSSWIEAGLPIESTPQISPRELHGVLADGDGLEVLDVRTVAEWRAGHIAGARHLMAGEVLDHLDQLPRRDTPLAIVCGGGYRSTVIASLLQREGWREIANVTGGMRAWQRAGLPVACGEDREPGWPRRC